MQLYCTGDQQQMFHVCEADDRKVEERLGGDEEESACEGLKMKTSRSRASYLSVHFTNWLQRVSHTLTSAVDFC